MKEDMCRSCRYRNRCPERSRMYPCSAYRKRTPGGGNRKEAQ